MEEEGREEEGEERKNRERREPDEEKVVRGKGAVEMRARPEGWEMVRRWRAWAEVETM